MPRQVESEIHAADGTRLHVRHWLPPEGAEPHGLVVLVHGLGEHGGRYQHVADTLVHAGFGVCAHDHRGHGRSGGLRGHVDGFLQYDHDLSPVISAFREKRGAGLPWFFFGQSMGGLIVLQRLLEHPDEGCAGAVLSNACLEVAVKAPALKIAAGKALSRILPRLRLDNEIDPKGISRDPAAVEAYVKDPLVHRHISTRWYTSLLECMARVNAAPAQVKTPTLWLISGHDPIVAPQGSRRFSAAIPGGTATVQELPPCFHEPHNDPEKAQVLAAIRDWLEARARPARP
jgi:alpha-beta hydrolase superfamily lysophospholipase